MAIRRKVSADQIHGSIQPSATPQPTEIACKALLEVMVEVEKFDRIIKNLVSSSYDSVKKYLGFMDFIAKPAYDRLVSFYIAASENLKRLEEISVEPGAYEEIRNTLVAIANYLKKENSLIPRSYGGIISQTDRAYIVHAQLMKLNVSKKISFADFPHNSTVIFTIINVLILILGKQLIGSMANTSDHLTENYLGNDRSFLQQFESVANTSGPRFIEDQMAETAAKIGGFGDINFHQSPSYD